MGLNKAELNFSKARRFLYISKSAGYLYGLLLTTKSYRKRCELKNANGVISVKVRETDPDAEPIDFNFFIIDPDTKRGLYLQYLSSCSIVTFGKFLHAQYAKWSKEQCEEKIKSDGLKPTGKAAKAIRKKYMRPRLELPLVLRNETVRQQLLQRLGAIKKMSFDYNVLATSGGIWSPFEGAVKSERHTLTFDPNITKRSLVANILKFVADANVLSGRVHGPSADDATIEDAVDLVYNPDVLSTVHYDEIADEQAFNLDKVHLSPVARKLRKVITDHPVLFPKKD